MKHLILILAILVIRLPAKSQNLSLTDLQYVCQKNSWESVNQYLISRGWEFYDSEKETDENYGSISWSYNKSYNGKSEGWLHLLISKEIPSKVTYLMFNQPAYLKIQTAIGKYGYKSIGSEIDDDEITSTYSNSTYILEIATLKRERESDIFTYSENYTAYRISLIKKGSIFDADNGPKVEYWPGSTRVQISYILKDGKLNGPFTRYYRNGKIKRTGSFLMDQEYGLFKEYDEDGNLSVEYQQKNDELSGTLKAYYSNGKVNRIENYVKGQKNGPFTHYHKNGKISKTGSFLENMEHGLFKEYDEQGNLVVEYQKKNDELSGPLRAYYLDGKLKISGNFVSGQKNGNFKEYAQNGELNEGYTMKEGKLHGTITKYENGKISEELTYENGGLAGPYINYHYNEEGVLIFKEKGTFAGDEKNGRWDLILVEEDKSERTLNSHFFTNGVKDGSFQEIRSDSLIFGTYSNGKLNGSYLIYQDFFSSLIGGPMRTDTSQMVRHCAGNYKNGEKTGEWKYYDITGALKRKGSYLLGKKTGEWSSYYATMVDLEGNKQPYSNKLYLIENFKNGKKEGLIIQYSRLEERPYPCDSSKIKPIRKTDSCSRLYWKQEIRSFTFKNDEVHGPCEMKDSVGNVTLKGNFDFGEKDGKWLEGTLLRDSDGNPHYIFEEGEYSKGKRNGKWIAFFNRGNIFESTSYLKGDLHGLKDSYTSGILKERKKFAFNKLKELTVYDSTGTNIVRKYDVISETQTLLNIRKTDFEPTYTESIEFEIKKQEPVLNYEFFEFVVLLRINMPSEEYGGYPKGEYKTTDNQGNELVSGNLLKDEKTGVWKYSYPDQNVLMQLTYDKNNPISETYYFMDSSLPFTGEFIYENEEDGTIEEIKIKEGYRNGTTVIKNGAGEVIRKEKYKDGFLK